MKLQTQIPLQKQSNNLIDCNSNILLLGSCFVENIGGKLDYFKFRTAIYNINNNNSMYKVDYLRIKYITKRLK